MFNWKTKKPILFKVTEPSSIPYRTHSACAKRAAYPDPPPVIPVPESDVAQAAYTEALLGSGSGPGPNCFQGIGILPVCVGCLFFKVTEPSSIPYRTPSACAKRAAYPDPPPVIPVPDTGVAGVTSLPSPRSLGEPRPNRLSSVPGSASGPKCFQVLGLSPSLLQNPML